MKIFPKILDDCRILGATSFVPAPTRQYEFFLWICGTLRGFFPKNYAISFLSEMTENNTDIESIQSISVISESMQVIFHPSDRISKCLLGTGS